MAALLATLMALASLLVVLLDRRGRFRSGWRASPGQSSAPSGSSSWAAVSSPRDLTMPEQKEQRQWPRCSGRHVIPSGDVTGAAEWLPVRIGSSSGFLSAAAGDDERRPQRRSGLPVPATTTFGEQHKLLQFRRAVVEITGVPYSSSRNAGSKPCVARRSRWGGRTPTLESASTSLSTVSSLSKSTR